MKKLRNKCGWTKAALFSLLILFLSSCANKKVLTNLEKLPCKEVIEKIDANNSFPTAYAGKYACEVTMPDKSTQKFTATVKTLEGEITTISIAPLLGIELFRMYLFQDSVVFLNKLQKQYYIGKYSYLSEQIGTELSLNLVQDLLSAKAIKYKDSFKYKCDRVNQQYVVKNVPSRKLRKALGINRSEDYADEADSVYMYTDVNRKLAKALKKDDDIFVKRYFMDPDFMLRRIIIHEVENNRLLEINYGTLQNFSGTQIPRLIELEVSNPEESIHISINPSKFKLIDKVDRDYNIPERYERIEFR